MLLLIRHIVVIIKDVSVANKFSLTYIINKATQFAKDGFDLVFCGEYSFPKNIRVLSCKIKICIKTSGSAFRIAQDECLAGGRLILEH